MTTSQTIPAVHKAVAVMQFVADRAEPVSIKELAYALGIPQATCYRMVNTLLEHNWLREEPGRGVRIAFGLANLARSYSTIEQALQRVTPALRQLAQTLQLSAKITLREGHYVTTALRAEPSRSNAITSPVGYHFHIGIGSAAAALLSTLPDEEIGRILKAAPAEVWERQSAEDVRERVRQCRKTGACQDFGQQHPSIYAISTLLSLTADTVAAVTVVGWPEDFPAARLAQITRGLKQGVAAMERLLKGDHTP